MNLSVIISNRNDVAMLSVTVRSCIEELKPIGLKSCEIIIVDNSDPETYEKLNSVIPKKYIVEKLIKVYRQDFACLFTARDLAANKASGKYIACVDSHMIIGRGMFYDLFNFMESKLSDSTLGFAHAPINWSHQHESSSKHDRDMSECELGNWGDIKNSPTTITWKGMPWICRREFFISKTSGIGGYGSLSQHRISWGGGDMHIGIKPWMLGFKNWAVPTSPGIHIGPFPKIDTGKDKSVTVVAKGPNDQRYRLWSHSGNGPHALGFLVSCYVIGGESMMLRNKKHITERFGKFINVDKWWEEAKKFGKDEKRWLDKHKVITFENLLKTKPWENV